MTRPGPAVDIAEGLRYGKEQGVKELLWLDWKALQRQIDEAFPAYEKWGAAGVKVDLMDHDDQPMVQLLLRSCPQSRRAPSACLLPWGLQADRNAAHLPQRAERRGCDGPGA